MIGRDLGPGSTDLIAFSSGCSGCGTNYAYYDQSKSSTSGYVDCGMTDYVCTNQCSEGMGNCNFDNQLNPSSSKICRGPVRSQSWR